MMILDVITITLSQHTHSQLQYYQPRSTLLTNTITQRHVYTNEQTNKQTKIEIQNKQTNKNTIKTIETRNQINQNENQQRQQQLFSQLRSFEIIAITTLHATHLFSTNAHHQTLRKYIFFTSKSIKIIMKNRRKIILHLYNILSSFMVFFYSRYV